MILKEAWKADIKVEGKKLAFDYDYPVEVLVKRKSYAEIKKVLKQNGIGFSTPFTKMRIRWDNGPRVYNDALEAARDMRKRGLDVQVREPEATVEERIRRAAASQWQRDGRKDWTENDVLSPENRARALRRAKQRLQEYRK